MAIKHQFAYSRAAVRFLAVAGVAALVAGCSDASRFGDDPFSDPFSGSPRIASRGVDRAPVGAIAAAPSTAVESHPLPAPPATVSAPSASAARVSAPPAISASAQPQRNTAGGTGGHWSAEGGTPIVVAQGETAGQLATRYGVPTDALLRANGFNIASQVQPGSRLVIPVYRAGGGSGLTARAIVNPVKSVPVATAASKNVAAKPTPVATKPTLVATKPAPVAKPVAAAKPAEEAKRTHKAEAQQEPAKAKRAEKTKVAANAAPEKAIVKAEPHIAAATPARPVKTERIARVAAAEPAAPEQTVATAKSKAADPETPSTTTAARKVDETTTASIPAANDAKTVASDGGRPEFRWPARGRIIQGFSTGGNDGINIAVPEGTQVKAVEGGVVAYAGNELKGYGNLVLIRHPNGFVSAYAHNGALDVKRGDQVKRGQTIAKSGQSGNVVSPQLHFELRKGSTPVDPTRYLAGL